MPNNDEELTDLTPLEETDQATLPNEENINQKENAEQEERTAQQGSTSPDTNADTDGRPGNTAIVTLPSGGGIAGIPGDHPPGKYIVDYNERTIKPYTDDETLEQNAVPVKPAQNPELLPPFTEPNITPVAQQPQEQPQPAETHDNAASSGTAPHYDSQVADQQKVVTERGA